MSVTLRDVAKRCGLSPSTVSGVLNNRSNTWASADTRRRIIEAAESLGYRPNHAARALRTGKTYVVALIYHVGPPLQHLTFDGAAEIMAAHLGRQGYELKLHVYPGQPELMAGLSDLVSRRSCDAVVLIGREPDVEEQGRLLEQSDVPFVVKGRHERQFPHWYQIDYDHEGMMRKAVQHMAQCDRRRIVYIGYAPGEVYQSHLLAGFCEAYHHVFHADPSPENVVLLDPLSRPLVTKHLDRWLESSAENRPDAFVIGTGADDWREIERVLAHRRYFLGDQTGEFSIAGQLEGRSYLAFGSGWCFTDVSYASIAEIAVNDLLLPLLRGAPEMTPVRRILPDLVTVPSLGLPRF